MKKAITIGIAALLLGLVLSVPLRVNGLEDEKSVIEGEITQPRRSSPISNGLFWSILGFFFCFVLGAIFFVVGLTMALFGTPMLITIVGTPLGILLLFLALIFIFILPVLSLIAGVILIPIGFIIGFVEGIANMPYDIGNFIIRLIDAIVPG